MRTGRFFILPLLLLFLLIWGGSALCLSTFKASELQYDATKKIYTDKNGQHITGMVQNFYPEGALKEESAVVEGKRHGLWKTFHKSGELDWERPYVQGEGEGIFKRYYKDGKVMIEAPHHAGYPEGLSKTYYPNGKLKEETLFVRGQKEGVSKEFYESGALKSETSYQDGRKLGTSKEFADTGTPAQAPTIILVSETEPMAQSIAAAQYLPADTMFLATISRITAMTKGIPASSLGRLLGKDTVHALMQELKSPPEAVAQYDMGLQIFTDFIYNPSFQQLFGDSLTFAVLPMDLDSIAAADNADAILRYILAVATTSTPVSAETFTALSKGKLVATQETINGLNMIKLTLLQKANESVILYAHVDNNNVLMALVPETIELAMAEKNKAAPELGLAMAKDFIEAERFWANYPGESTYAQVFVNLERFLAAWTQATHPDIKAIMDDPDINLGLMFDFYRGLQSSFGIVYTKEQSLDSVFALTFDESKLHSITKKVLTTKASDNAYLYLLQKQPLLYIWGSALNLEQFFASLSKNDPQSMDREMKEAFGLGTTELAQSIGPQYGFMLDSIVNEGLFPIPKIVLWAELRDEAAIKVAIDHIRKLIVTEGGPDAVETKEGNTSFLSWPLMPGDAGQPAVAVHNKTLYITSSVQTMKNILTNTAIPNRMPEETITRVGKEIGQKIATANSAVGLAYPKEIAEPLLGVIDFINHSSGGGMPTTVIKREFGLFLQSIDYTAAYCNLETGKLECTYTMKWAEENTPK